MTPELSLTEGSAGLIVSNLRKSYRKRLVIRDVSLTLKRGEVVALLGPNGSGKTTCFYAIAGLIDAEAGQVMVDGRDVSALPMYRRANEGIGYLPQEMSIFRGLNVEDNILAILEISTPRRDERQRRLEDLLTEFSIEHLRRAPALALSGGERRRAALAKLMAERPELMLLDEPTNHLDIPAKEMLEEALQKYDGSVIVVSHDRYFISKVANKIVEIRDGEFRVYLGDYHYYLDKIAEEKEQEKLAKIEKEKAAKKAAKQKKAAAKRK